ncbi:MAG: toll/interleukin-1 receptor domain-containing protein [Akkermansia sp.]|nr:toll/interleukin-1 receptor domain-containing protein [Akkermansia sp.]
MKEPLHFSPNYKEVKNTFCEEKTVVDKDEIPKVEQMFSQKEFLPLPNIANIIREKKLWEGERINKAIIQYSFLVLNKKNEIMLYSRTMGKVGTHGHQVSTNEGNNYSALISNGIRSEVPRNYGGLIPYYQGRVFEHDEAAKYRNISFLGVVKNTKYVKVVNSTPMYKGATMGPITYLFYVFTVQYDYDGEIFRKPYVNPNDPIAGFFPLEEAWHAFDPKENQAELGALSMLMQRMGKPQPFQYFSADTGQHKTIFGADPGHYIVHAEEDHPFTQKLTHLLHEKEIRYWIDDTEANSSDTWVGNARDAIRYAQGYIITLGKKTLTKPHVIEELQWIEEVRRKHRMRPVIILIYDNLAEEILELPDYKKLQRTYTFLDVRNLEGTKFEEQMGIILRNNHVN